MNFRLFLIIYVYQSNLTGTDLQNMGQAASSVSTAEAEIKQLHCRLAANFNVIKSLATASHIEVVHCIEELNTVLVLETAFFSFKCIREAKLSIEKKHLK